MGKREFTIEDIEADMLIAAELVDKYGPLMQPLLDRCEREYEKLRKPKEVDRIKAKLAADHAEDGR